MDNRIEYLETESAEIYNKIEAVIKNEKYGLQKAKNLYYLSGLVLKYEKELTELYNSD